MAEFLNCNRMEIIFRKTTQIGVPAFQPESKEEHRLVQISLITEGAQEEKEYFQMVYDHVPEDQRAYCLEFVNDLLYDIEKDDANPEKRLQALLNNLEHKNKDYRLHDDLVCLVCDRDNQSFPQFDNVLSDCIANGINFICSTPCFQLWLLFHFTNDIEELINLKYTNSAEQKKWIEELLKKYHKCFGKGYQHGKLGESVGIYITRVGHALDSSAQYATEPMNLKDNIGTNVGSLITQMYQGCEPCRFYVEEIATKQKFEHAGLSIF